MGPHFLLPLRHTHSLPNLRASGVQTSEQNAGERAGKHSLGRRLSTSDIQTFTHDFLKNKSEAAGEIYRQFQLDFSVDGSDGVSVKVSLYKTREEETIVVLSGVKDTEQNTKFSRTLVSLSQALQKLFDSSEYAEIRSSKHQVIVPLAIDSIQHWVMLRIEFNGEDAPIEVNVLDSKPNWFRSLRNFFMNLIGFFNRSGYSYSSVEGTLKKQLKSEINFSEYGLGQQGLTDATNCGRYVSWNIQLIFEGKRTPEQLAQVKFSEQDMIDFDKKLANIEERQQSFFSATHQGSSSRSEIEISTDKEDDFEVIATDSDVQGSTIRDLV